MTAAKTHPELTTRTTKQHRRTLLFNCVVAAVGAVTAMIMVHEAVHLIAGWALGFESTMYAFGVSHAGNPSAVQSAIMSLSAPLFSLVSGVAMSLWLPLRHKGGFAHLMWLFFAFSSTQEGIAYLCLTPFGAGDTGSAATVLGVPIWASVLAGLIGVAGMFGNARLFATHLARHAGHDQSDRNAFTLFPWLYGMLILTALTFVYLAITPMDLDPMDQIAIVAANTVILVFAPMANIFRRQVAYVAHEPLDLPRVPMAGLIATGALVVINVVLATGVLTAG